MESSLLDVVETNVIDDPVLEQLEFAITCTYKDRSIEARSCRRIIKYADLYSPSIFYDLRQKKYVLRVPYEDVLHGCVTTLLLYEQDKDQALEHFNIIKKHIPIRPVKPITATNLATTTSILTIPLEMLLKEMDREEEASKKTSTPDVSSAPPKEPLEKKQKLESDSSPVPPPPTSPSYTPVV